MTGCVDSSTCRKSSSIIAKTEVLPLPQAPSMETTSPDDEDTFRKTPAAASAKGRLDRASLARALPSWRG